MEVLGRALSGTFGTVCAWYGSAWGCVTVAGQAGMVMTALYSELFTHRGSVFHFSSLMGSQRRWPLGQGASALCLIINSTTDGRRRVRRERQKNRDKQCEISSEEKQRTRSNPQRGTGTVDMDWILDSGKSSAFTWVGRMTNNGVQLLSYWGRVKINCLSD